MSTDVALSSLTAISPLDGRYWAQLQRLSEFFSEFSLIKYRVHVEVEYFIALCKIPLPQLASFPQEHFDTMRGWATKFSAEDAAEIKSIERTTNHDVKAVEYFLKRRFDSAPAHDAWQPAKEFIHFALTSQDINNTAIPLSVFHFVRNEYRPALRTLVATLTTMGSQWADVPMLARTHGQPATPTRLGKEIFVFVERLQRQLRTLDQQEYTAKFGGATGGFNAHVVAYGSVDWPRFADEFVESLGLRRERCTTQIAHYDSLASLFDVSKRVNTILMDMARDFWQYISMDYFKQKIVATEVGSSAMPHKVNPIDFENAEGNLGIANALFEHLAVKLPISRLQRDLTDSTVLRNVGVPFAHTMLALYSLRRALGKLVLHEETLHQDLLDNWIVVSEAIQTVLRREAYPEPYEALKALTRTGEKITAETMATFVAGLAVSDAVKAELVAITPFTYIGVKPFPPV